MNQLHFYYVDCPDCGTITMEGRDYHNKAVTTEVKFGSTWTCYAKTHCPQCKKPHGGKSRVIQYKRNASRHACDSRCQNARGRNCECACNGANHGRGAATPLTGQLRFMAGLLALFLIACGALEDIPLPGPGAPVPPIDYGEPG